LFNILNRTSSLEDSLCLQQCTSWSELPYSSP